MAPLPHYHGQLPSLQLNKQRHSLLTRSTIVRRSEISGVIIGVVFGAAVLLAMLGFIIHLLTYRPSPPKKTKKHRKGGKGGKKKPKNPKSKESSEDLEENETPYGFPFYGWAGLPYPPDAGEPWPPGRVYNGGGNEMDAPQMEYSDDEREYGFDRPSTKYAQPDIISIRSNS
ncbi:uncharacterized protein J7T54_004231 [Emericellopsis cladophorae]|uniref:Uncharacterized protein n=1 Tax=Emericellopsis cladophorae TaxID=2686198 RepID=A0A9P9XYA2_9HYPO|nr:uncharacterized protein J7T54_004231 [Emericellopsis cladophorae]KAI6780099.1 hypothetical protein J7T54_004231 [Emericellopsis cladophorae]